MAAERKDYDVCVAYAIDDQQDEGRLRDWSFKLASTLEGEVSPPCYPQDPNFPQPRFYRPPSGKTADWHALREASKTSALLLVIVSPAFCASSEAAGVVKTFLDATTARGGTADSIILITAAPMPAGSTPADALLTSLIATGDARRNDFYDENGKKPIEYHLGVPGSGPFELLWHPIIELANEIRCKLKALRLLAPARPVAIEAEAQSPDPAPEPPRPDAGPPIGFLSQPPHDASTEASSVAPPRTTVTVQLYLRDHGDAVRWNATRLVLSNVAVVNPQAFAPGPRATRLKEIVVAREQRIGELLTCNAMALVRASATDALLEPTKTALWDLNFMRQNSDPEFAWFMVDWIGEPPPPDLPAELLPPRVFPQRANFDEQVRAAMASQ